MCLTLKYGPPQKFSKLVKQISCVAVKREKTLELLRRTLYETPSSPKPLIDNRWIKEGTGSKHEASL